MQRALTSASNILRRKLCPGSARLEDGLPEIKTKESEQGVRLHNYSAHPEYERRLLPPEEQDLLKTADQLEEQAFDVIGLMESYTEQRECELGDELISGHPDLLRIYGEKVSVVTDRKFGWADVDRADVNLQLRVYAVLAPTPDAFVAILQPRALFQDRVTIAKYNADSKSAARREIAAIMEACKDPDAPLVPGEDQCRYCKARAICPALNKAVTTGLMVLPELSPELSKAAMLQRIEESIAKASNDQLDALYRAVALAKIVNDPLGDEMRRRIGVNKMPGYKLGNESEVRTITNTKDAISLLVLSRIANRDEILDECCSVSLTEVEKLHRKKAKVTAKEAKADINKALESVLEKESRKPRILKT